MAKLLALTNAAALIITLAINYLSNTGIFNGETMATVSDRYKNLFTPAGFTFSIWGLIYTGLICFVIYTTVQAFKNKEQKELREIGWWFTASCIANCFWVLAWLYDYIAISVLIMIFLLFCLVMIIVNTNMERRDDPLVKFAFLWWPFAIYSGWISVALIANMAAWLTKTGWQGWNLLPEIWTFIMLLVASLLGIYITWARSMREYAVTIAWGIFGIAIANKEQSSMIWYMALTCIILLVVNSSIHAAKNWNKMPWKK